MIKPLLRKTDRNYGSYAYTTKTDHINFNVKETRFQCNPYFGRIILAEFY